MSFIGALPITVLADFFGTQNLASSLGLRAALMGVVVLSTPVLIGVIVDYTDSYYVPFYASTTLAIVASVMVSLTQRLHSRAQHNPNAE